MKELNLDTQIDFIRNILTEFDKTQVCTFIALSLKIFFSDRKIFSFLNELYPNSEHYLKELLDKIALGKSVDMQHAKFFLSSLSWDIDELSNEKFDYSEGAFKFLGGIDLLLTYIDCNDIENALNASIQFLEQIEYYMMLSEDRPKLLKNAESLFDEEIKNQRYIIDEIKNNILKIDFYMNRHYSKELIDSFYDY